MYFFIEQQNELTTELKKNFSEDSELVNEIFENANVSMYEKYNMPAVHLWGDGYCKGDASNEELIALAERVRVNHSDCYYNDEEDENLFECLDSDFLCIYRAKVEAVVKGSNQ